MGSKKAWERGVALTSAPNWQVCEELLAGGLDVYKREGPKYLQRLLSRQKKGPPE